MAGPKSATKAIVGVGLPIEEVWSCHGDDTIVIWGIDRTMKTTIPAKRVYDLLCLGPHVWSR